MFKFKADKHKHTTQSHTRRLGILAKTLTPLGRTGERRAGLYVLLRHVWTTGVR